MKPPEQLGRYQLTRSDDCFKLGRDSMLLARFATLRRGQSVCDLGCGIGTLLLLLSERETEITRCGVELDPKAAALARQNLADNHLTGDILDGDLRSPGLLPNQHFHLVVSNPPYFETGSGRSGGPARMDETLTIQELCAVASRILRTGGRFAIVFRPERLAALFAALAAVDLAPKRMQLLSHRPGKEPFAVLLESVKSGGAGLQILPNHYETMKNEQL